MSDALDRIWAVKHRAEWPWDEGGVFYDEPQDTTLAMATYLLATPAREAADDMLAALEELADLMESVRQGDYTPDSFTCQPARAAIAKARGAA